MNKDNNIYKDQLKALFNDFEADTPIDGWDKLDKSLSATKRAVIVRRNWYIGSAAAIAVILITGILFINGPKEINNIPHITEVVAPIDESDNNKDDHNLNKIVKENHNATLVAKQAAPRSITQIISKDKEAIIIDDSKLEELISQLHAPSETEEIDKTTTDERKSDQMTQEEIDVLIKELQEAANINIFDESDFDKKETKPLMLAINARGGLTSSQKTSNSPMRLRSASSFNLPNKEDNQKDGVNNDLISDGISSILPETNTADNIAEMVHSQPYSVGITVSKALTDKLYIETGLVYTYLYSESKNTSIGYADKENQELHYLGVPVNLNYNFLELGRFNIFTSIGGMIEKDIYGVNRINATGVNQNFNTNLESKHSNKINLKNPQFSVNAGVGASYALYEGINIYAKIGGAYYFNANNHEYRTIYSDKKILLDINAGLRFQF